MPVIDIHTHMLTLDWIELLRAHGSGRYDVKKTPAGQEAVHPYGRAAAGRSPMDSPR